MSHTPYGMPAFMYPQSAVVSTDEDVKSGTTQEK